MNIKRFPCKQNDVIGLLEEIIVLVKEGKLNDFVFAGKTDKEVITSWSGDLGTRQELLGHVQIDIMMGVMEVKLVD